MKAIAFTKYEKIKDMAIDIAQELIRFDNQNPPGSDQKIAAYIHKKLESFGMQVTTHQVDEHVYCVRAVYGNPDHIGLIFSGHLDVVPVTQDWARDPFDPVIIDGRMYGRGSCDMKSGLAAMMAAASYITQHISCEKRGLALVFNGDEEISNKGMKAISPMGWLRGDAAIIGEPTECEIHLGNRGASIHHVVTKGKACHASRPWLGDNAIYKMAEAVLRLRDYADKLSKTVVDKYLGPATLSVGVIRGGQHANIVPDECTAAVERRLLWKEDAAEVSRQIQQAVGDLATVSLKWHCPASLLNVDHPFVSALSNSVRDALGKEPVINVFPASTEGAFFSVYNNVPTLICGPGNVQQAHTANEWIEVEQIRKAVHIYIELALRWLKE